MQLLSQKGIFSDRVLISEASHRREWVRKGGRRSTYPEDYEPALRDIHRAFSDWIWDNSQAHIVLLVGQPNVARLIERFRSRAVRFRLPCSGRYGAQVFGYLIRDNDSNISQIVICCQHPERCHRYPDIFDASNMDAAVNLAIVLSGVDCTTIKPTFLVDKVKSRLLKRCESEDAALAEEICAILLHDSHQVTQIPTESYSKHIRRLLNTPLARSRMRGTGAMKRHQLQVVLEKICPVYCMTLYCNEPAVFGRYCAIHYDENIAGPRPPRKRRTCWVDGCSKYRKFDEFCVAHWTHRHPGQAYPYRRHCRASGCKKIGEFHMLCRSHWRQKNPGRLLPKPYCKFSDCKREIQAGGLCASHWKQHHPGQQSPWRSYCSLSGCKRYPKLDGLCTAHWRRKNGGQPCPVSDNSRCKVDGCNRGRQYDQMCVSHWRQHNPGRPEHSSVAQN